MPQHTSANASASISLFKEGCKVRFVMQAFLAGVSSSQLQASRLMHTPQPFGMGPLLPAKVRYKHSG